MKEQKFYPMSHRPKVCECDERLSVTVLVYDYEPDKGSEQEPFCELGWFDFEEDMWAHHGDWSMDLGCWCYIPNPYNYLKENNIKPVKHIGYEK